MDPAERATPSRTPSPNQIGSSSVGSSSSASPNRSSPIDSPLISRSPTPKAAVKIQRVKLNDAPVPAAPGLSSSKAKEVKDKFVQLATIYELWTTLKLVETKIESLPKKSPELPSLKQKQDATRVELNKFDLNVLNSDFLFSDLKQLKLSSAEAEEFCIFLIGRMKLDSVLDHIGYVFDKEVSLRPEYNTVNRISTDVEQIFITAFQNAHLDNIFKLKSKYTDNYEEEALSAVKKLAAGIKENKDNSILNHFYTSLYKAVESKFPGRGEDLVISLILLRYLGPKFMAFTIVNGLRLVPDNNKNIAKAIISFDSKSSPTNMNLSPEFMAKGFKIMKEVVPHIISKP